MLLDGAHAHDETARDLGIGEAACGEREDLGFAGGEPELADARGVGRGARLVEEEERGVARGRPYDEPRAVVLHHQRSSVSEMCRIERPRPHEAVRLARERDDPPVAQLRNGAPAPLETAFEQVDPLLKDLPRSSVLVRPGEVRPHDVEDGPVAIGEGSARAVERDAGEEAAGLDGAAELIGDVERTVDVVVQLEPLVCPRVEEVRDRDGRSGAVRRVVRDDRVLADQTAELREEGSADVVRRIGRRAHRPSRHVDPVPPDGVAADEPREGRDRDRLELDRGARGVPFLHDGERRVEIRLA